jgi:diguanylate cyclase (GGDEF)-like protein
MFLAIIAALAVCARVAGRSGKRIGSAASVLLVSLILPMAGNMIIILSSGRVLSLIGCYLYYIGLDVAIAALIRFTFVYCGISWPRKWVGYAVHFLLLADVVQLLLNLVFHHAFRLTAVEVDGYPYYRMIPLWGQQFHRALDYLLLAGVIAIFIVRLIRAPRLQTERYSVILFALILVTGWETAYIFSGAPIDRSMIGFGVFGLLIFYFSVSYRPMRLLDRMLAGVVSGQKNPIFFFDESKRCIWMNRAGAKFLNLEENDLEAAEADLKKAFGALHPDLEEWKDHLTIDRNGESRYIELIKQTLVDSRSKMDGFFFYIRDLTDERREAEQKLYEARHDRLTGVYNRDYMCERTREVLAENPDEPYVVYWLEVTDLRTINDLYGVAFGDHALKCVAEWLRSGGDSLGSGTVYGRLNGDSFGVCVPEKYFSQDWLEEQLSGFAVREGTREHRVLIHVGVYRVTDRSISETVMYDRAMLAMENIKDDYHFHVLWYDDSMRERALWNRRISGELSGALETGEIRPWLQPIMDREGKTIGAEALVRWIHPEEGIRPPNAFIPVFERNGMIAEVDRYIWRKSCEILARWKQEGKDLFISVNISPKDFYLLDVPVELKRLVREYGVEPAALRLEITETMMMSNPEEQLEILKALREAGFCIEMDDFGSGYSSLNLLREMPVDVLKIDMVFLRQAGQNPRARTIIRQVIAMARELGITSLTEGVETKAQYEGLREMGCELYQGYYFAKPMPEEDFERFLSGRSAE